jgi:hypothetical protein
VARRWFASAEPRRARSRGVGEFFQRYHEDGVNSLQTCLWPAEGRSQRALPAFSPLPLLTRWTGKMWSVNALVQRVLFGPSNSFAPCGLEAIEFTPNMDGVPVLVYYLECAEGDCWALFDTNNLTSPRSRPHGHPLHANGIRQGFVTPFEARQGWTRQKPDDCESRPCATRSGALSFLIRLSRRHLHRKKQTTKPPERRSISRG